MICRHNQNRIYMHIVKHYLEKVKKDTSHLFNGDEYEILSSKGFDLDFLAMIKQEATKDLNVLEKMKLIPEDLKCEVDDIIYSHYDGKKENYLNDIEIYFKTIKPFDLFLMNASQKELDKIEEMLDCLADYVRKIRKDEDVLTSFIMRQLKKAQRRLLNHSSVLLKLVGAGRSEYCSRAVFGAFKLRKVAEQKFINESWIHGTDGVSIPLSKATKTSKQDIAEKLNIINTMEKFAKKKKFTWVFITLTLPPEYHPNPSKGRNSYNGVSPRESGQLLNEKFNLARAKLLKIGLKPGIGEDGCYFGATTGEAHKDGCLHKHVLMFCDESNLENIRGVFQSVFNNMDDGSFRINNGKAKASSYVFKYVMKSVVYFNGELDIMGEHDKETTNAMKNNCFRSENGLRAVSFFGIERCLTKFRFLARNLGKVRMNARLFSIIKVNDLFSFIDEAHDKDVKIEYVEINGVKKFVGCIVDNIRYLKRLFTVGKVGDDNFSGNLSALSLYFSFHSVLVNHNYSRGTGNYYDKNTIWYLGEVNDCLIDYLEKDFEDDEEKSKLFSQRFATTEELNEIISLCS